MKKALLLPLLLGLAACGEDSVTGPVTAPVTGDYDLVIVPAAGCGFPAGPYSVFVQAQQAGSPSRPELRATLPGGNSNLVLEMLFFEPGMLRGSIATRPQEGVPFESGFGLFLRNVGTGTVSEAAGGRGEVRDATMFGDVRVFQGGVDLGTCMSADHRWSLRVR